MSNEPIKSVSSINEDYQRMLDSFEDKYFYDGPPDGFYLPLGVLGAPLPGLGFNCNKCKLNFPYGAPAEVKHCARQGVFQIDAPPKWNWLQRIYKRLPTWQIRKTWL